MMEDFKIIRFEPSDSQGVNDNIISIMINSVRAVSNLMYIITFVVNVKDYSVIFTFSPSTGLRELFGKINVNYFPEMVEFISGGCYEEFELYMNLIRQYYIEASIEEKSDITFITDLPFKLNVGNNIVTFKMSPLAEDHNGELMYLVCSISFSAGDLLKKLMVVNYVKKVYEIYDVRSTTWRKFHYPKFTPIERSVLALSAQGLSVDNIAQVLFKALDTIKSVRKRIFIKLGVNNMSKAIIRAINYKII